MDHFIETVRKYPCLWNTTAIEYRDHELKDAAWTEVMKETDLSSVKEVKLKWKKLRDSYRDALKRQNEMLSRDPSSQCKKNYPWKYSGHMQFLQPYMSNRKKPAEAAGAAGAGGAGAARNGHATSSESESEGEPPAKRRAERLGLIGRKLDYLCQRGAGAAPPAPPAPAHDGPAPLDPLDIFFNSMCQSTKRFPFQTQIKIKRALFEAVMEAEEALVTEQQSYASLWADAHARPATSSASSEPDTKPC